MTSNTSSWSTEQLTAFLASITHIADEESAARIAVEHAAEALDCEFGALVRGDVVVTSVGFAAGKVPAHALIDAAVSDRRDMTLPDGQIAEVASATLEDPEHGNLLVARLGGDPFRSEEVIVLRGMARILGMTMTTMRTVKSLQERQALLERSTAILRAITLREPIQVVLDLICTATAELLGDDVVWLRVIDPDDPREMRTVARHEAGGVSVPDDDHGVVCGSVADRAVGGNRLVTYPDRETYSRTPSTPSHGLLGAMATPIHEHGAPIGSLVVASRSRGRLYSSSEQEMLVTFAQHASIAFLDARTVEELQRQALHDPLTALANRALFRDRLEHALARAEREGSAVAVLFVDLDRFKTVNDSLGHSVGDALLAQVGDRLEALARSSDTVARLGGDEFALLIEDVEDHTGVGQLAERINKSLSTPFTIGSDEVRLSASIGIAIATGRADDPIGEADHAMYRAKRSGRDRFEFFEPRMRTAIIERLELEGDLKHALDRGEFVLLFLPVAELATGRISGAEALIRWRHPVRGLLEPRLFIPLAEETGAIYDIGNWVLREACELASGWSTDRPSDARPFVGVNLAPIQLQQPELVGEIAATLAETGLDASRLMLEITEMSLLEDERAISRLHTLKRLGLRIAVDDFGTGYSSLHHLQRFPLDALKIPKPFIDQLGNGPAGSTLAHAIIGLGATFGLDVLAEGIEDADQLVQLRRLGCREGQGFLLSRPVGAERMTALIADPSASLLPPNPAPALTAVCMPTIAEAAGATVTLPSAVAQRMLRRRR